MLWAEFLVWKKFNKKEDQNVSAAICGELDDIDLEQIQDADCSGLE